jgi:hypothetical protein
MQHSQGVQSKLPTHKASVVMSYHRPRLRSCLLLYRAAHHTSRACIVLECCVLFVRLERVVALVQAFQCFFTIFGEVRPTNRSYSTRKETRLPLCPVLLAFGSLFPLLIFDLLLERCCERILLVNNGVGDTFPELP